MAESTHEVTVWLQLQPKMHKKRSWEVGDDSQEYVVDGFSVIGVTKGRPTLRRGGIAMQVTLRIPDVVWLPLVPRVVVDVPEDRVLIGEPFEAEVSELPVPVLEEAEQHD